MSRSWPCRLVSRPLPAASTPAAATGPSLRTGSSGQHFTPPSRAGPSARHADSPARSWRPHTRHLAQDGEGLGNVVRKHAWLLMRAEFAAPRHRGVAGDVGGTRFPRARVRATPLYDGRGQLCTAIRRFRNATGTTSTGSAAERDGSCHRCGGDGRASGSRPLHQPGAGPRGPGGRHHRGRPVTRRRDRLGSRLGRAAERAGLPAVGERAAEGGPGGSASGVGAARRRGGRRPSRRSASGCAERRGRPDDRAAERRRGGGGGHQACPPRPATDRRRRLGRAGARGCDVLGPAR